MPRALGGAEQSRKPFLESPADAVTSAPDLRRLGKPAAPSSISIKI